MLLHESFSLSFSLSWFMFSFTLTHTSSSLSQFLSFSTPKTEYWVHKINRHCIFQSETEYKFSPMIWRVGRWEKYIFSRNVHNFEWVRFLMIFFKSIDFNQKLKKYPKRLHNNTLHELRNTKKVVNFICIHNMTMDNVNFWRWQSKKKLLGYQVRV